MQAFPEVDNWVSFSFVIIGVFVLRNSYKSRNLGGRLAKNNGEYFGITQVEALELGL